MPFGRCWRLFQKIPAYVQICSNCLCPFTSRSRLFALTTDLPGPADGTLNIVQGNNSLASWSQNQNPFRMSEGDESDGNLGVLLIRTLDDTRYSSRIAISWCSCLATSRWWWIQNRSSISYLTKFPRCWRFFRKILAYIQNFPCPFTSRSRLFALTTEHCTRQYPCILIPEPFQDQWRWRKWRKFGSVAHSNFGWYEVLVGNCHLLMQLSSHVKVMMDIHNRSSISYLTKFPRCWRRSWLYSKFPCPFTSRSRLFALTTDLPEMEKRRPHFSSATPYDRHQFGLGQWRSLRIGWLVEWTLRDLWTDLSHHFINGVHPSQASLQSTAFSWQESQYHKYCTILYLFQWQGPYRYCVRLEGCSGGVGAHCTTPAGDDQHSWRSVATPTASTWKWTDQCPNNTVTAYRSSRNGKTRQTQRLGCLVQISTARKSEY